VAKTGIEPASNIAIGSTIAAFQPRLQEARGPNSNYHKAKEHNFAAAEEHDGFQLEQPDDSEEYIETAKEQ
jgi:hypothetical protein